MSTTASAELRTSDRDKKCSQVERPERDEENASIQQQDVRNATAPQQKGQAQQEEHSQKFGQPPRALLAVLAVLISLLALIFSYPLIREFLNTESTEDAYVTGHVHPVSAKIAGTIDAVLVKDNQWVEKGQVLVTVDAKDVQVELSKAQAHLAKVERDSIAAKHVVVYAARNQSAVSENANGSIAQAENSIEKAESGIAAAESDVALAKQQLIEREAELHKSNLDLERYTLLAAERAVKLESLDEARKNHDVAAAARDAAEEAVRQADSRLKQAHADLKISQSQLVNAKAISLQAEAADAEISVNTEQEASSLATIKEAQADLQNAKLRLSYTKVVAPVAGRIGKKTAEEGQRIQPGTPLMSVVSSDKWIVANFKETQLKRMRIGQKVKIAVDALGEHEFNGRVESFSPASGASFALLPPDNATGNFTKIVQRIPVKIVFEQNSLGQFEQMITPGMSCDVKVQVK